MFLKLKDFNWIIREWVQISKDNPLLCKKNEKASKLMESFTIQDEQEGYLSTDFLHSVLAYRLKGQDHLLPITGVLGQFILVWQAQNNAVVQPMMLYYYLRGGSHHFLQSPILFQVMGELCLLTAHQASNLGIINVALSAGRCRYISYIGGHWLIVETSGPKPTNVLTIPFIRFEEPLVTTKSSFFDVWFVVKKILYHGVTIHEIYRKERKKIFTEVANAFCYLNY